MHLSPTSKLGYLSFNRTYKNERIESVWSTEGKLYAKLKQGQRIRIFPFKALSRSSTRTAEGRDTRK